MLEFAWAEDDDEARDDKEGTGAEAAAEEGAEEAAEEAAGADASEPVGTVFRLNDDALRTPRKPPKAPNGVPPE